mmetsp:Transcript_32109/g.63699  ORF Transcript_32109/g.63699 Transcript_32109/m.63699 type:complete len:225 (-) Transcript_32109:34-708(-)
MFPGFGPHLPQATPTRVLANVLALAQGAIAQLAIANDRIHVWLEEKRRREALTVARVDDAVHCGFKPVRGPTAKHVPDVHHKRTIERATMDPLGILCVQDLQTANAILAQQGKQPVVGVLADTDLGVKVLDRPIMEQAQSGDRRRQELFEIIRRLAQNHGHDGEQPPGQPEHFGGILLHGLLETGQFLNLREPRSHPEESGNIATARLRPWGAIHIQCLFVVDP